MTNKDGNTDPFASGYTYAVGTICEETVPRTKEEPTLKNSAKDLAAIAEPTNSIALAPGEAVNFGCPNTDKDRSMSSDVPSTVGDSIAHGKWENASA